MNNRLLNENFLGDKFLVETMKYFSNILNRDETKTSTKESSIRIKLTEEETRMSFSHNVLILDFFSLVTRDTFFSSVRCTCPVNI